MSYQTAIDTLQRLANQYQGLVEAAEILSQVSSLDQLKKELTAASDAARADLDKTKKALADAKAKLDKTESDIDDATKNALVNVNSLMNDAKAGADGIVANAKIDAAKIIQDARDQAAQQLNGVQAAVSKLQDQAAVAQKAADDAVSAQAKAEAELENITKKLEQAKAKIASLIA